MKKILLPVEYFAEEPEIINEAVDIAKKFGSKITIFHADNTQIMISRLQYEAYIDRKAFEDEPDNKENIDKIIKVYEDEGLEVEVILIKQEPAYEIITEAE